MDKEYTVYELNDNDYPPLRTGKHHLPCGDSRQRTLQLPQR